MAQQHFYSRVPAKVSMYNKADGLDTFAHSQGLTREFIEQNLSQVYDIKPTKEDMPLIREGKLKPVYYQFMGATGELIQSCVSYLPVDFTGERSTYLAHTLVCSQEEKDNLINKNQYQMINPQNFQQDLSFFDIGSFDSTPDKDYPVKEYSYAPTSTLEELNQTLDTAMLRRFVYAMVCTACKKTKCVYFAISQKDNASQKALEFYNMIIQIFPYHMRPLFPFVSYVGEYNKFPGAKVKGVSPKIRDIPSAKGVYFNFVTKTFSGLEDENVATQFRIVKFLCDLISAKELREEFILFCDRAVKSKPDLATPTLRNLDELILLFIVCSGHFEEKLILPNDATVFEFINAYERNRLALSDEFRAVAMKCLQRYPKGHIQIPNNVFTKINKLYPTEVVSVKNVIMRVVLDLIHTNVMRDKLFKFINANYASEDDEIKVLINEHLSRVFYGGFLQTQIIEFFCKNFKTEPEPTRDIIVEKILLSIRTVAIQQHIFQFFSSYYDMLTDIQKSRFYTTYFEMLSEGDMLAQNLTQIVDEHVRAEPQSFRDEFVERLLNFVEVEQKKKEHKGFITLALNSRFCMSHVVYKIFTDWSGRKIFQEYIKLICQAPIGNVIESFEFVWKTVPYMDQAVIEKFITEVQNNLSFDPKKLNIYMLISIEEQFSSKFCGGFNKNAELFLQTITKTIIHPQIIKRTDDVFNLSLKEDGVECVLDYANKNSYLMQSIEFVNVQTYIKLKDAAVQNDHAQIPKLFEGFSANKDIKNDISNVITQKLLAQDLSENAKYELTRAIIRCMLGPLNSMELAFTTAHNKAISEQKTRQELPSVEEMDVNSKVIVNMILAAKYIDDSAQDKEDGLCAYDQKSEIWKLIENYIDQADKNQKTWFVSKIKEIAPENTNLIEYSENLIPQKAQKLTSPKTFLSKLFGKNKTK